MEETSKCNLFPALMISRWTCDILSMHHDSRSFMKTMVYSAQQLHQDDVRSHIREVLHNNGLVVFPTETVYGIGASALSDDAVNAIYLAKGRPSDNPLIVHVASQEDISNYAKDIPAYAKLLMDRFMPGPLTLVLHKQEHVSKRVTGGLETVAIRIPNHPIALEIINIAGLPICAPSANLSGKPSSTQAEHVLQDFDGKVDIVIDGGPTTIGLESTVLDLTSKIPTILRPGQVTQAMIESVLGLKIQDASDTAISEGPKSPGMKYQHYAPKGRLILIRGSFEKVVEYLQKWVASHPETGIICPSEYAKQIKSNSLIDLGSLSQIDLIGSKIFAALREMDKRNVSFILMPVLPEEGLGIAIMNRLYKASSHQIMDI